ncbi:hypothetical protein ABZX12_25550 [Kribbella sp. NPDC003505]|uniref:immunity protein TriTu family protein n=1 Tax=Kribbella sp. NPDC003505 TaxID=3154448 RepID=UPI0033A3BA77
MDRIETMTDLLNYATEWVEASRTALTGRGIEVGVDRSSGERDNPSLWIDLDRGSRMVRLTLWSSGAAVLAVAEVGTGSILLEEQLELVATAALDETLRRAVTLASGE